MKLSVLLIKKHVVGSWNNTTVRIRKVVLKMKRNVVNLRLMMRGMKRRCGWKNSVNVVLKEATFMLMLGS